MKPIVALALLCLTPRAVAAQQPLRLTLEDAIARGLANSHRLAELQARKEGAEAAEAGREVASMPSVSILAGYTRTNHVEEFAIVQPGQRALVVYPDVPDNYRTRLDLAWPVYSAGRTDALERAAESERKASEEDIAAARSDLRLEIVRAFWALVSAIESERVLARSLDTIGAHVRDLRSRFDQGLIAPNEVLTAEAQQSRERVFSIEATNLRGVSEADLRRLIGLESRDRIEPVAVLERGVATPSDADVDALITDARANRAERRALEDRLNASRAREAAVSADAWPQIGINAGYDYARPNPRVFPRIGEWHDSWDASVNLSWSLWDGGRRRAQLAETVAASHAISARAAEFDRAVSFEVQQRQLEVESNRAAIDAAQDGVRSAVEAQRVVMERYRAGVVTNTDVLDANLAVLQAELDLTRARANARLAEARLERAIGR
ncbi:MAG: TolC family protein [Vicinamibacterales bacterium]